MTQIDTKHEISAPEAAELSGERYTRALEGVTPRSIREGDVLLDKVPSAIEDGRYVARGVDGNQVSLTLDPELQVAAELCIAAVRKHGLAEDLAIVAAKPNGEIVAFAQTDRIDDFAFTKLPSASIAKLATVAAALDAGARPDTLITYPVKDYGKDWEPLAPGEVTNETPHDVKRIDEALARSVTAAFPWLAREVFGEGEELDAALRAAFERCGLQADFPSEEAADAAAGLSNSNFTVFDAARLLASIASDGKLPTLSMVEGTETGSAEAGAVAMQPETAQELLEMMRMASSPYGFDPENMSARESGTARGAFFDGFDPKLPGVSASTKGGTINSVTADHPEGELKGFKWFTGTSQTWSRTEIEGERVSMRSPNNAEVVLAIVAHKPAATAKYACNNIGKALLEKATRGEGTFEMPGKFSITL